MYTRDVFFYKIMFTIYTPHKKFIKKKMKLKNVKFILYVYNKKIL